MLFNLLQDRDLNISHPNGPTFVSVNGQSVIDLCICSTKILRSLSTVYVDSTAELFSGAPRRGHYPIIWSWRLFSKCQTVRQIKKDFDNADWTVWKTALEDNLTAELDGILESDDPETIWDITKSALIRTVDTTIPVKLLSNHSKPFWNSKLSELSLTLRRNRIAYRKRNNKENLEELLKCKDAFKEEINSAHNSWLQRNLDHLNKADTTNFWKRYKTTLLDRDKSKMGPLKNDQNEILFNPQEKSDLLRKSFFTGEHLASENFSTQSNIENYLSASRALTENSHAMGACLISHSDVEEALRKVKSNNKSLEIDGFHPNMLRYSGPSLSLILTHLFNCCIQKQHWVWKKGKVIFIAKSGKKDYLEPKSYRPITLSSIVGKILESVLSQKVLSIISTNNFLDDNQEGFRKRRGTSRLLYKIFTDLREVTTSNLKGMLISIDLEKAFDSVNTNILMTKLHLAGIKGDLLGIVNNLLSTRKIQIILDDFISEELPCHIGLPQGSILSPLLFIIFITDLLDNEPRASVYKYADDTSILLTAQNTTEVMSYSSSTLEKIFAWCHQNQVKINTSKTAFLPVNFTPSEKKEQENFLVKGTKVLKDDIIIVGTIVGNPKKQVTSAAGKGWADLNRIKEFCSPHSGLTARSILKIYKLITLPKILYGVSAWSDCNLDPLITLQRAWLYSATGSFYNPANCDLELLTDIKPVPPRLIYSY